MTCIYPKLSVQVGTTFSYPVSILNIGDRNETLYLDADGPEDWGFRFKTPDYREVLAIFLFPNQSFSFTFEVSPPSDVNEGEYNMTLRAVSDDQILNKSLSLGASLYKPKVEEELKIVSMFPEVTAEAGEDVHFPITLMNLGLDDLSLILTIPSSPSGWKVVFKTETGIVVSKAYSAAGESLNLDVVATPPSTVSIGNYTIQIQAKTERDTVSAEAELRAKILGSYELGLQPSSLRKSIRTGGSAMITVEITNDGLSTVTTLALEVELPTDWDVTITPAQVDSLNPGESFTFAVVIESPDGASAGDYLITVKASSDQIESDEVQIRLTAEAPMSWVWVGVILAIIAVVALVVVFKVFKRR